MSPSQEVLNSIENRLRELEREIAALEFARSELQASEQPCGEQPSQGRARRRASRPAPHPAPGTPKLTDEEWVARRAAELASQSRAAAA